MVHRVDPNVHLIQPMAKSHVVAVARLEADILVVICE
jgi:hypothetical protein